MSITVVGSALSVLLLVPALVVAEPPSASAPAASAAAPAVPPAGKRIVFEGNSWFNFVPGGVADCAKTVGIEGHEALAWKPRETGFFKESKVDVYAHGVHHWGEVPWSHGVTAEQIVAAGLEGNPDFRGYYHAAWLVGDGRGVDNPVKTVADYDASTVIDVRAKLEKTCRHVEKIVDGLNEKFGKRCVYLVPVGEATLRLREAILAGTYPGLTKQSEIWSDAMPHAGAHVMALSGYCHFAAIYRMSPVGLKISRFKEITDEQHAILQRIAWDVVSQYPYAGIAPFPKVEPATAPR
jgi:hypothetical protein